MTKAEQEILKLKHAQASVQESGACLQNEAEFLTPAELIKQLDTVHELPTLPSVAQRVNTMLQDINTPAKELAQVIEKDQAIVPKLLKLVNSAFYGFNKKITSISHAVMLIGYNTVRNAIISVAVIDSLKLKDKFNGFDITQFWEHAIAVGTVSRYLDEQTGNRHKENSFTAGLIHDVGKILMANCYPGRFADTLKAQQVQKISMLAAERQYFPLQHDAIGAYLALKWNLPDVFRNTIAYHHHPDKVSDNSALIYIVYVADALVHNHLSRGKKERISIQGDACRALISQIRSASQWMPEVKKEVLAACQVLLEGT
jgi:putative nucleotidyltransferase with HDIG domain